VAAAIDLDALGDCDPARAVIAQLEDTDQLVRPSVTGASHPGEPWIPRRHPTSIIDFTINAQVYLVGAVEVARDERELGRDRVELTAVHA
jgi:hypothetical protein